MAKSGKIATIVANNPKEVKKILTEFNCNSIVVFNNLKERRNTNTMLTTRTENRMYPDMSVNYYDQGLNSVYAIRSTNIANS